MAAVIELTQYNDNTIIFLFSHTIEAVAVEEKNGKTTIMTQSGREYVVKNKAHDIIRSAGYTPIKE